MAKEHEEGGYACDFVEEPAKEMQTECGICLHVLCKPDMVSCCGEKFCHTCIEQVMSKNNPCPHCNSSQFTTMADKKLERELNGLKVYCTNKNKGCDWIGYLKDLDKHCNSSKSAPCVWTTSVKFLERCSYETVWCTKCKEGIVRSKFDEHILKGCSTPEGECLFNYAGCNVKVSSKDMKHHLEQNMAVHLSLIMDVTRKLSYENARMNEHLARLSTEAEHNHERSDVVLRNQKGAGKLVQEPTAAHRRQRWPHILWIVATTVILILSILAAQNNNLLVQYIKSQYCGLEINLVLRDIEDKINGIANDVDTMRQRMDINAEKIKTVMEDLKGMGKAVDSCSDTLETIENLKSQLPIGLKLKLDMLSSDLAELGHTIEHLATKEDTQLLRKKLDILMGLQKELVSLKLRLDNLPHPLSQAEISALVAAELEAHRPPHRPPHDNHGHHHHHGHGHGGCRRHY